MNNKASIKGSLIYFAFLVAAIVMISCKGKPTEAPVLLFNGTGTSPNDVEAIENILSANGIDFGLINSDELNDLNENQLRSHKLIIIPGGDFIEMGKGLTTETTGNIQKAVHHGLNYLGICAGGFLAGSIQNNNSFNFTDGVQFKFYSAEYNGIRKAPVAVTNADEKVIDHYWQDGPELTGWGDIISKYPDGTPATVQGSYGEGWIVLTGIHPEAPEYWRKEFQFSTSIESSHQYAASLIKAAMEGKEMSHF